MLSEHLACLAFSLAKISAKQANKLIELFGSLTKAIEHENSLKETNNKSILLRVSTAIKQLENLEASLIKHNIKYICYFDEDYPNSLKNLEDPPYCIYYKGNLDLLNKTCVSVVGTRRPSSYGLAACDNIAKALSANNICVISGFALGIDTQAHISSYKNIGKTIAVLGCGLAYNYPASNSMLKQKLIDNDCLLISEFAPNQAPVAYHFPYRNRLISGLSKALVFVEGKPKSGGILTVNLALENNIPVYAVPGSIFNQLSLASNTLISDKKAVCLSEVDILLNALSLGNNSNNCDKVKTQSFFEEENLDSLDINSQNVYRLICEAERSFDELLCLSKLSPIDLQLSLASLEFFGYIEKLAGNNYRNYR